MKPEFIWGSDDVVDLDKDEVAYLDDLGFVCRKWELAGSEKTLVDVWKPRTPFWTEET